AANGNVEFYPAPSATQPANPEALTAFFAGINEKGSLHKIEPVDIKIRGKGLVTINGHSIPPGSFCGRLEVFELNEQNPGEKPVPGTRSYQVLDTEGKVIFKREIGAAWVTDIYYDTLTNIITIDLYDQYGYLRDKSTYYDRFMWEFRTSKAWQYRDEAAPQSGVYLYEDHVSKPIRKEDNFSYNRLDGTKGAIREGKESFLRRFRNEAKPTPSLIESSHVIEDGLVRGVYADVDTTNVKTNERNERHYRSMPIVSGTPAKTVTIAETGEAFIIKGADDSGKPLARPVVVFPESIPLSDGKSHELQVPSNSKLSVETRIRHINGKKTVSYVISVDDPFGKLIFKQEPTASKRARRIYFEGQRKVIYYLEETKNNRYEVILQREYEILRTNQLRAPDEWYLTSEKMMREGLVSKFTWRLTSVDGENIGYQISEKTEEKADGSFKRTTNFKYRRPQGNRIGIGKLTVGNRQVTDYVFVRPGTIQVIKEVIDQTKNTRSEYTNCLFPMVDLERTRAIAQEFYGRYLDLRDLADQQLISTLLDYKTVLGLSMENFLVFMKLLSGLKQIEDFDTMHDQDGEKKQEVVNNLIIQAQIMRQSKDLNLNRKDAQELSKRILAEFTVTNANYPFTIDYQDPADIGKWFWIFFLGYPRTGTPKDPSEQTFNNDKLRTKDEFINYINAFNAIGTSPEIMEFANLRLKNPKGTRPSVSISSEEGMDIAKFISAHAMNIANSKNFNAALKETRSAIKTQIRTMGTTQEGPGTDKGAFLNRFRNWGFRIGSFIVVCLFLSGRGASSLFAQGSQAPIEAAREALQAVAGEAAPAGTLATAGQWFQSVVSDPVNQALVIAAAIVLAVVIAHAVVTYLITKVRAHTYLPPEIPAAGAPAAPQAGAQAQAPRPAAALPMSPADIMKTLEDIQNEGKGLIGGINDDLALLERFKTTRAVDYYNKALKVKDNILKTTVLDEMVHRNIITPAEILERTNRPDYNVWIRNSKLKLTDIAEVLTEQEFEKMKKLVYAHGGTRNLLDFAKATVNRYKLGALRTKALVHLINEFGITNEAMIAALPEDMRKKICKRRNLVDKNDNGQITVYHYDYIAAFDLSLDEVYKFIDTVMAPDQRAAFKTQLLDNLHALGVTDQLIIERIKDDIHHKREVLARISPTPIPDDRIVMAELTARDIFRTLSFDWLHNMMGNNNPLEYRHKRMNADMDVIDFDLASQAILNQANDFNVKGLGWGFIGSLFLIAAKFVPSLAFTHQLALIAYGTLGLLLTIYANRRYLTSVFSASKLKHESQREIQMRIIGRARTSIDNVKGMIDKLPPYIKQDLPTHTIRDAQETLMPSPYRSTWIDGHPANPERCGSKDGHRALFQDDGVTYYDLVDLVWGIEQELDLVEREIREGAGNRMWTRFFSYMNPIDKARRVEFHKKTPDQVAAGAQSMFMSVDWSKMELFFNVLLLDIYSQYRQASSLADNENDEAEVAQVLSTRQGQLARAIAEQVQAENNFRYLNKTEPQYIQDMAEHERDFGWRSGFIPMFVRYFWTFSTMLLLSLAFFVFIGIACYGMTDIFTHVPILNLIPQYREFTVTPSSFPFIGYYTIFFAAFALQFIYKHNLSIYSFINGIAPRLARLPVVGRFFFTHLQTSMVQTVKNDLVNSISFLKQSCQDAIAGEIVAVIHNAAVNNPDPVKARAAGVVDRRLQALLNKRQAKDASITHLSAQDILNTVSYRELIDYMIRPKIDPVTNRQAEDDYHAPLFEYDGYFFLFLTNLPEQFKTKLVKSLNRADMTAPAIPATPGHPAVPATVPVTAAEILRRTGAASIDQLSTLQIVQCLEWNELKRLKEIPDHPDLTTDEMIAALNDPDMGDRRLTAAELQSRTQTPINALPPAEIEKLLRKEELETLRSTTCIFPYVTLVVSTFGEEEVVERVCNVITSSGYPGTRAIIAGEAKDNATNKAVAEAQRKHRVPQKIDISLTATRMGNAPTIIPVSFYTHDLYRRIPMKAQTKPYADNQANAMLVVLGVSPYTFNLIDVEDRPQRRYLWEQTVGFMMMESTLDRLSDRLRRGEGISPKDLKRDRKRFKKLAAQRGITPDQKTHFLNEKRKVESLLYNSRRWNIDNRVDLIENGQGITGILSIVRDIWRGTFTINGHFSIKALGQRLTAHATSLI
ncbi:MAG: hypothetical protein PHS37_07465, partial [Candidatus Omnitrophica bacterium]|nr:hypothetical protein [Candidatus Omnitrophota bacterium]